MYFTSSTVSFFVEYTQIQKVALLPSSGKIQNVKNIHYLVCWNTLVPFNELNTVVVISTASDDRSRKYFETFCVLTKTMNRKSQMHFISLSTVTRSPMASSLLHSKLRPKAFDLKYGSTLNVVIKCITTRLCVQLVPAALCWSNVVTNCKLFGYNVHIPSLICIWQKERTVNIYVITLW